MARKQTRPHRSKKTHMERIVAKVSAAAEKAQASKGEVVAVWKNLGETPLEALNRLRIEKPLYATATLSYAGRLDPAAEGVLLVLVNEANKDREKYLGLDKTYEIRILFGVSTDTYDVLGTVTKSSADFPDNLMKKAESTRLNFIGDITQDYPPYSSKTIDGKALFQWAREAAQAKKDGEAAPILELPKHVVNISSITFKGWEKIGALPLYKHIEKVCSLVKGDFRQKTIIESWGLAMGASESTTFQILRLSVSCGSGTYMRTLAYDFGKALDLPALAFSISRTKTGKYVKKDCIL